MTRRPSQLTAIGPGESIRVEDQAGGLIVSRPRRRLSWPQMQRQLDALAEGCPKIDTLAFLQEGEA
jgi:hypothetical protein